MALEKTENITKTRRKLNSNFDKPGIYPVTVNDKFVGVVLSIGDARDVTAARLSDKLKANQKAAIDEIYEITENGEPG